VDRLNQKTHADADCDFDRNNFQNWKLLRSKSQWLNSPASSENYTIPQLKAIVHFKKRKGDAAVPTLKGTLKQRYDETNDRPDLTLIQFLADRGYNGDDVDHIVSEFSLA
jgi:hypothetical protein